MVLGCQLPASIAAALALLLAAYASPARSAPAGEEAVEHRVGIMAAVGEGEDMAELVSALGAYLTDLDVAVVLVPVEEAPVRFADQVAAAREIAARRELLSVVWVERTSTEFLIFVSDEGGEEILVQSQPKGLEGWDADCDAISVLVRSALKPWLERPAKEDVEAAGGGERHVVARDPEPVELTLEPGRRERPFLVVTGAGYAGGAIMGGEWNQGARLDLGVVVGRHVGLRVAYRILRAVEMDVPGVDLRLSRWPLEVTVDGILPLGRVEIALFAGVVVDMTAVRGLPGGSPDETEIVKAGLAAGLFARVRLNDWLAAFAEGGAHVFSRGRNYRWDGEVRLVYRPVHPTFAAGLAVFLPIRGDGDARERRAGS